MTQLDRFDLLFITWAFMYQAILVVHFGLRKWRFDIAMRFGRMVYMLGIPAALLSLVLIQAGKPWWLWAGGLINLVWATLGYTIEYIRRIQWRSPPRWEILIPYVSLFLGMIMFYWWPVGMLFKPLWYVFAVFFVISSVLNLTSHHPGEQIIH